jgi:hypothetical protein
MSYRGTEISPVVTTESPHPRKQCPSCSLRIKTEFAKGHAQTRCLFAPANSPKEFPGTRLDCSRRPWIGRNFRRLAGHQARQAPSGFSPHRPIPSSGTRLPVTESRDCEIATKPERIRGAESVLRFGNRSQGQARRSENAALKSFRHPARISTAFEVCRS